MSSGNRRMNKIDLKIAKAAQTKLNRIANGDNGLDSEIASLALKTFTNEQLMRLVKQLAPLAGLKPTLFRATSQIHFANSAGKQSFQETMRGLVVDGLNIFRLSRKTKNLLIHGIINGTVTDDRRKVPDDATEAELTEIGKYKPSTYYYVLSLARERVYLNKKGKTLDFPMFDEVLDHLENFDNGDAFDNIAKDNNLTKDTKIYVNEVLKYAKQQSKQIIRLIDAQVNNCDFSSTPVGMYGFLSYYRPEKEKGILHSRLWTRVCVDLIRFTDGDMDELDEIVESFNYTPLSQEMHEWREANISKQDERDGLTSNPSAKYSLLIGTFILNICWN